MLHGDVDCKVKVGPMAWHMLKMDIKDAVRSHEPGDMDSTEEVAEEILRAIEDRLLSSINLGGF